eukprot:1140216-Pelagomonas_calceolata.AAC.3
MPEHARVCTRNEVPCPPPSFAFQKEEGCSQHDRTLAPQHEASAARTVSKQACRADTQMPQVRGWHLRSKALESGSQKAGPLLDPEHWKVKIEDTPLQDPEIEAQWEPPQRVSALVWQGRATESLSYDDWKHNWEPSQRARTHAHWAEQGRTIPHKPKLMMAKGKIGEASPQNKHTDDKGGWQCPLKSLDTASYDATNSRMAYSSSCTTR